MLYEKEITDLIRTEAREMRWNIQTFDLSPLITRITDLETIVASQNAAIAALIKHLNVEAVVVPTHTEIRTK